MQSRVYKIGASKINYTDDDVERNTNAYYRNEYEVDARQFERIYAAKFYKYTVAGSAYPYTVTVVQSQADSIYYTTDGSHPYAGNPQAKLYSAPVTVTEACLFRARAFGVDGDFNTIASDTAAQNFTA